MKIGKLLLVFSPFILAAGSQATELKFTSYDFNRAMGIVIDVNGEQHGAGAGIMNIETSDGVSWAALCLDLFTGIDYDVAYQTDMTEFTGAAGWLMETYLPAVDSPELGAGLQLAVWDIQHDGGDGLDAGSIRANSFTDETAVAFARQILDASVGQHASNAILFQAAPGAEVFQPLLALALECPPAPASDVPEPGGMILAGIGVALFGLKRTLSRT